MKRLRIILSLLPVLASCVSENGNGGGEPLDGGSVRFTVRTEATKALFSSDFATLAWEEGEALSILDGSSNVRYTASGSGEKVVFTSTEGISDEAADVFAVSPYSADALRSGNGVRVHIPSAQDGTLGYDPSALVSAGYSSTLSQETELTMRNLCSFLKFTVPAGDKITELVLKAGEGEYIAGDALVTFDSKGIPAAEATEDGGESEIVFSSSVPFDGEYVVALLPCILHDGLSVTLRTQDGRVALHKVVARDENGVESAITFRRDKVNRYTLSFSEPAWLKPAELTVEKVFWSDAYIEWNCEGEPDAYKLYVDGSEAATLDASVTSYHLTGLTGGTRHSVAVAAIYNHGDEDLSQTQYFTTGSVERLTKNLSPTSLAFAIENMAGDNTTNNNPCLFVQLLDAEDPATASVVMEAYVLDAQVQSPASPFFGGYAVDSKKSRAPLNVALGNLKAGTDYWFRVKSVARHDGFKSYVGSTATDSYCESSGGDSEFSLPLKATTPAAHTPQAGELLFEGFDELMFMSDYVNVAVGSVPAYKKAGKAVGSMSLDAIRNWDGDWCFYGMRTVFAASQLAAHYAWGTQQTKDDELFTLSAQGSGGTIKGTAPGVGTKVYKFKDSTGSLSGWYSSNNTFACQGYICLGSYYTAGDAPSAKNMGMLATPALSGGLGSEAAACTLSFKGLVLQGRSCALAVWRYDAAAKAWSQAGTVDLYNSAGITEAATEWSSLSDTHRWYSHSMDVSLAEGDRIALCTDKNGAAVIDEICVTLK